MVNGPECCRIDIELVGTNDWSIGVVFCGGDLERGSRGEICAVTRGQREGKETEEEDIVGGWRFQPRRGPAPGRRQGPRCRDTRLRKSRTA